MGRNKGSRNKPELILELTVEERMELLAKLLLDTVEHEMLEREDAAKS